MERRSLNMEHEEFGEEELCEESLKHPLFEKLFTEEQKKKIVLMLLERRVIRMEMRIGRMEKMIELKKKAIGDVKQIMEMIKQGK